ncbi:leucine-rich repeat domain-containing protein [Caproiciproducens sp. CPB-2]|uniref:leucine-rich repeat domain-containing protein n=1 Tax=Caproiciproducens sp. CPB-2 TaxID=3030017 RepID=UPI0023D9AAF4|nr:leucine-rich repeat domain-containing protein [Caproiciproducens sp. CPB-2]MDF1495812.1 leucine-rich repeat domain-containing protein [Caproiciproducens sp. CPB-2]
MKRTYKVLSLFLILAVLMGVIFSTSAFATGINDFTINNDHDVIGYKGKGGNIAIPQGVLFISQNAFGGNRSLISVSIPSSVKYIDNSSFAACDNLISISVDSKNTEYCSVDGVLYTKNRNMLLCYPCKKGGIFNIPSTVTIIDGQAAAGSNGLVGLTIPNSVKVIGDWAFEDCKGLKSATIGNGVTYIGSRAFEGCTNLANINIPSSVTTLGYNAFSECIGLNNITIPGNTTSIGVAAFEGCSGLTNIIISSGVEQIDNVAFYGCTGLTTVTIPNTVTSIGYMAFSGCTGLSGVMIPNSVTSIDDDVFKDCDGVTISGYENTAAQTYAAKYNIPFISLGVAPTLPKSTLTLDTTSYVVAPRATYEIGAKLTGFSKSVKVYSSSSDIAKVEKLENGNYKVTGLKSGTTYIMFDVYNSVGSKVSHASVRITVQNGAKSHGDSTHQIAVF